MEVSPCEVPEDAETVVATALAIAYVRESGLLEDNPRRYIDRHRPHARDAIQAYEHYLRSLRTLAPQTGSGC